MSVGSLALLAARPGFWESVNDVGPTKRPVGKGEAARLTEACIRVEMQVFEGTDINDSIEKQMAM